MNSQDIVRRMRQIDSCAFSDALDKLGLKGTVTGLPRRSASRRIAGRVVTLKLVEAQQAPRLDGAPRHLGTTAIESAQPGDIVVVEQRTGIDAGSWGGILSLGAKVRGLAGVIADGPVRDADEAHEYDFPIYARSTTAFTARGRVAEGGTNVPVRIGDITVHPGDYAVADSSGVVFIAAAQAQEVLRVAEEIAAREAAMARALLAGRPITEVMGANYENMLAR
ncbi:MAG: RraA family protein [Pigmentiphaga sp.]|uniref:RraA family protein n=1 Tax=Pigmentiphaga sp. TaxID=1977564 RepID=UPI0029B938DC|nr:RraA family protein [Pigmentiphaga sp.]MDX3904945.1 RraA family protein [Pigmentiphaga sp.]